MREYIRRCKEAYSTGGSKIEYVRHVLLEFEDPGRRELVWRGTKALIDLSRDQRRGKFIPMHKHPVTFWSHEVPKQDCWLVAVARKAC